MSNKQKKAMREEINRQIIFISEQYDIDYEAMVAFALHKCFGFGYKRLMHFRKTFIEEYKRLKLCYQMDDTYPARHLLKNILGYDVEQLLTEDRAHETTGQSIK